MHTPIMLLSSGDGFVTMLPCCLLQSGAVAQLLRLVPARSAPLLAAVLRLLHNLSFDAGLREQMVAGGLIQKVGCLQAC